MILRDIMQTDVVTVKPDTTTVELEHLFTATRISGVPVVGEDGKPIGMVSQSDVLRCLGDVGGTIYNSLTASALMSIGIVTAEPSEDVCAVARLMHEKRIHRVLVCEDGKIVGIVSTFDTGIGERGPGPETVGPDRVRLLEITRPSLAERAR